MTQPHLSFSNIINTALLLCLHFSCQYKEGEKGRAEVPTKE